jgi:hypothetical protein
MLVFITFTSWTDGEAGLAFRGIGDSGQDVDMTLGTFPTAVGSVVQLNGPRLLMSAAVHPTWDTIAEPDRAFFRAMRYTVVP